MRLVGHMVECQVHDVSDHNTESSPHLPLVEKGRFRVVWGAKEQDDIPHHNESASDYGRSTFSRIYGDRCRFRANTKSENQTSDEKMLP